MKLNKAQKRTMWIAIGVWCVIWLGVGYYFLGGRQIVCQRCLRSSGQPFEGVIAGKTTSARSQQHYFNIKYNIAGKTYESRYPVHLYDFSNIKEGTPVRVYARENDPTLIAVHDIPAFDDYLAFWVSFVFGMPLALGLFVSYESKINAEVKKLAAEYKVSVKVVETTLIILAIVGFLIWIFWLEWVLY